MRTSLRSITGIVVVAAVAAVVAVVAVAGAGCLAHVDLSREREREPAPHAVAVEEPVLVRIPGNAAIVGSAAPALLLDNGERVVDVHDLVPVVAPGSPPALASAVAEHDSAQMYAASAS